MKHPILYATHECPYCQRTEATLFYAGIQVELRTVDLNHLPAQLTGLKANASVPFLLFEDGSFIDESWEICKWALQQNDPDEWLGKEQNLLLDCEMIVETNDHFFAPALYDYRKADNPQAYRSDCEEYLEEIEDALNEHRFLVDQQLRAADIITASFVRLFSLKEPDWFANAPYPKIRTWLKTVIATPYYQHALTQHPVWNETEQP